MNAPLTVKSLQGKIEEIDMLSQNAFQQIHVLASLLERFIDEVHTTELQTVLGLICYLSEDAPNLINCISEDCGASYRNPGSRRGLSDVAEVRS